MDPQPPATPSPLESELVDRPHGPVEEGERILTLDVLRGFALLGILMVNMQFFAMPFGVVVGEGGLAGAPRSERFAWGFVQVFFTYKFISLFSLMFGMGLVVALTRAEAAQRPFVGLYIRRLAILALFGLCHALLFWYGDILFFYSLLGVVLLLVRGLSHKALLGIGATLIASSLVLGAGFLGLTVLMHSLDDRSQLEAQEQRGAHELELRESPRGLEAMIEAGFDPAASPWMEAETRAYREGPFSEAFQFRAVSFSIALVAAGFSFGWRVLGLFLVGAALMKLDIFRPSRRAWHRRLALWGLAVGLPLELLGVWSIHLGGYGFGGHRLLGGVLHEVGSLATAFGYAGLVALVVSAGWLSAVARRIGNVGRMALTVYLTQTLLATGIMYWWGLGWFGEVSRVQQIGLVVLIYALQILVCTLWLQWFRFGPFEWLWRVLTYGRWQPLWRAPSRGAVPVGPEKGPRRG